MKIKKWSSFELMMFIFLILVVLVNGLLVLELVKRDFKECDLVLGKDKWVKYFSDDNCGHISPCITGCQSNITGEIYLWD